MSADLPLECSSPTERDIEQAQDNDRFTSFKSFLNPALGVSVSSSLGQLRTPATVDPGQQAPFFTPFSNKAFDTSVVTESDAFFSALGTGLRSSQSVRSDANAGMRASRQQVSMFAFAEANSDSNMQGLGSAVDTPTLGRTAAVEQPHVDQAAVDPQPPAAVSPSEAEGAGAVPAAGPPVVNELGDTVISEHGVALEVGTEGRSASSISISSIPEATQAPVSSPRAGLACSVHSEAGDAPPSPDASVVADLELGACQQANAVAGPPPPSDVSIVHSPLPDEEAPDTLLEGSGETSGSLQQPSVCNSKKQLSTPARSLGQRPVSTRRDAAEHAPACATVTKPVRTTPASTSAVRKATPSARRLPSEVHGTPMSVSRPGSAAKQSAQRTAKADADIILTSQKSVQRQRRASALADDQPMAATPRGVALASPIRRASNAGAAAQPAAGGTGTVAAALGDHAGGTGTPFFLKRIRHATDKSPISPFANLKAQPTARGTACAPVVPAAQPAGAGASVGAAHPVENPAPPKQPAKKVAKGKAPAAATVNAAGTKGTDAKAVPARKAAAADAVARAAAGSDAQATRRDSAGGSASQKAAGKAAAPHASAPPAKVLAAANRATAAPVTKPGAAATARGAEAKQAKGKAAGGAAAAAEGCCDLGAEPMAAATRMILTRKPSADGANGAGVAACRYGRARTAAPDPTAAPAQAGASAHSPEKLPPSKRHAKPVTSPSKRLRQEQGGVALGGSSAAAGQTAPAGRTAAAPPAIVTKGAIVSVPSCSPGRLSPILARGPKPSPASARKPRPSVGAPAAEPSPMQITPCGSSGKTPLSAIKSPPHPASVPKLNIAGLLACKSPAGTPRAVVAADMVPLRQQPVSSRSPVLTGVGGPLSARRTSAMPVAGASPASATARRGSLAEPKPHLTTPPAALTPEEQHVQPMSCDKGVHPKPVVRTESEAGAREPQQQQPQQARERKAQVPAAAHAQVRPSKPAVKPSVPAAAVPGGTAADAGRPLTARPALGVNATKGPTAVAARGAVTHRGPVTHKPSAAAAAAPSGAAPKPQPQPAAVPHSKPDRAAVQAPKAKAPPSAHARDGGATTAGTGPSGKADGAQPHAPIQAGAGAEKSSRNPASRAPNPGATLPAARSKQQEPEKERADRRKQYEALLGRTAPMSPRHEPAAGAPPAAASPAGKPAAKAQGTRAAPAQASSPLPPARGPMRKASAPAAANQADGRAARHATNDQARGQAQPQRGRATRAAAAKQLLSPRTGTPDAEAAGEGSAGAAQRPAEKVDGTASGAVAGGSHGTVRMLEVAGRTKTPQSNKPPLPMPARPSPVALPPGGQHTPSGERNATPRPDWDGDTALAIGTGANVADAVPAVDPPADTSPSPKPRKDLSWLVDASPCGSLAVTPGALAAVAASPLGNAFGFGDPQEDPAAVGEPANDFGFGDAQPAAAGEAARGTVLPFFSPLPRANSGSQMLGKPPIMPVALPQGLLPMGLGPAGPAGVDAPNSAKSMMPALTPGSAFQFTKLAAADAAGGRPKPVAGPTPVLFPQAKLRFSWDPSATPPNVSAPQQQPVGPGFCPTPGLAVSGIEAFNGPVPMCESTPTSLAAGGGVYMAADGGSDPGSFGAGVLGDSADRDLPAELPVPVQCTSPNTPPHDPFAEMGAGGSMLHAGSGAAGQGVVVFGGGGGMGRAGRAVEDSFDALRISSMSYWPLVRDREHDGSGDIGC